MRNHRVVPRHQTRTERCRLCSPNAGAHDCIRIHFRLFLSRGTHAPLSNCSVPRAVTVRASDPRCQPRAIHVVLIHVRSSLEPPAARRIRTFPTECLRRAGATAAFDVIPIGPMNADPTSGRRGGRCRCREASARIRPTGKDVDRCDSRLRHRPDEGWCRTRGLRKAT